MESARKDSFSKLKICFFSRNERRAGATDEIRWSNGRIGRRGHDRALRKRADRSGKWTNHVPSLPPSRNQPSPFAPSACFWSYHPWIPSAQHLPLSLPLSRSAPFIFPSARVYVSPFENVAKSFFSFQTSRSPTVVQEGTIPENLPCLQTRNQSRNRDTSALILSTKYTCSFSKSRGYFTRLQLRSRIITRRRCKAAFIKLLCRRGNVWRTPPARGMRLILAVYITETFHSATQLPSNTKYSPPPCWFGKMNSEGVAGGYSTYGLSEIIETLVNSREREVIERRELLRSADLEMNGWPEASGWREVWKRKGEETRVLFRFEFNYVSNVRIRNYRGI